jgi:hypothetical protein
MTVRDTGLASEPPHHPGMDRRRFLLTSLAGALGRTARRWEDHGYASAGKELTCAACVPEW